ncbi:MAG TPA: molybdopterin oxidoreductase family protein [Polyangiaceae bacterium]
MESTRTHCPYCALQCGMRLSPGAARPVEGDAEFPVNRGALCIKGFTAAELLRAPDRLTTPLVRDERGDLVPATWDEAIGRIASAIRRTQERHGRDAVGVFGSGALTNEKAYAVGKLARAILRTRSIDYNGRYCMSSAATAATRALGLDRGLPFPVADLGEAGAILLAGSNVAETMPPLVQHLDRVRARGGEIIVVDPRRTATVRAATLHLPACPGTDAVVANGLLHVLVRDGLVDEAYVRDRTEGFEDVRALVAGYWPERVERISGVPQRDLERAAHALARASRAFVLTGRGCEQQSQGVANALAFIDVALALGLVGRPGSGWGCLTGQGNGQGGREHGQKADQLPGYRRIDDPAARAHVARVWGMAPESLPDAGASAYEMLSTMGAPGGVRALLVFGSNVLVSSPDATAVEARLRGLDLLVVSDFFLSETAALAHVVLPSAQFAEEDGTMTNLEGRVIRRRVAVDPPAGVRTDLAIIRAIADAIGEGGRFPSDDPRAVFDELRRASAGGPADYAGITWDRIDRDRGVFWPCPSEDHPGTPRLFESRFPTPSGRARFFAVRHAAPAEEPDAEYPLVLTTGRLLAQYQSGTQTRRIESLVRVAPHPVVEMHPAVARPLGIEGGEEVTVVTRRGGASFVARVTRDVRPDVLFVPFHWGGDRCANLLTSPALDPSSRMPEFKVCAARLEVSTHVPPRGGSATRS